MWNAIHSKSLASAILISLTIQGALLWQFNQMSTEGTGQQMQAIATRVSATAEPATPALREVTLAPVMVVGRREAVPGSPDTALASTQPTEPEARSAHQQHDAHM